ncbi:MAG: BlaI/MecI/CopY family transcriptional regulator [Bacteroidota bacterium]
MRKRLTAKEEEIMQILWELKRAFVKEIIEQLPDPKPHYNTISTLIRRLEGLGFVDHERFGNTHRYFPLVEKEAYKERSIRHLLNHYFDNSYQDMVTFFAREKKISPEELKRILKDIEDSQP